MIKYDDLTGVDPESRRNLIPAVTAMIRRLIGACKGKDIKVPDFGCNLIANYWRKILPHPRRSGSGSKVNMNVMIRDNGKLDPLSSQGDYTLSVGGIAMP